MRYYVSVLFVMLLLMVPWMAVNYPKEVGDAILSFENAAEQLAAVVVHNPKTVAGLQSKYNTTTSQGPGKIRVLIIPGHEPEYGGAEYADIKERELTPVLAADLAQFLNNTGRYETFVTRQVGGNWSPWFQNYWNTNWNSIVDWERSYKQDMSRLISLGTKQREDSPVEHNAAPVGPAIRLYSTTKWANENDVDVIIHIHFNDYPGHGTYPGKYSGFTIYAPSNQYDNSTAAHAIADSIFKRLSKYNPVSNLPAESRGVVDDPELIAVGANNTSDAPSLLIEYAYIYEPQMTNPNLRDTAIKDMAYQTFLGLQDFFDPSSAINLAKSYDTLVLPHQWKTPLTAKDPASPDVFALQTALLQSGLYPPTNSDFNDCPRSGKLGPCTKAALKVFQGKYGITDEPGFVGPKTEEVLNQNFGRN